MQKTRKRKLGVYASAFPRCGTVISLLALMFLSTGCFQSDEAPQPAARSRELGPNAIWPLQNAPQKHASVQITAAEALPFGSESRTYAPDLLDSGEPFAAYSQYPFGSRPRPLQASQSYSIGTNSGYSRGAYGTPSLLNSPSTNAVFGKSFGTLFASLFKKGSEEADAFAEAAGEESRNPFRDAVKKVDPKPAATAASKADSLQTPASPAPSAPPPDATPGLPLPQPAPASVPPDMHFVFLGDFDGSGVLKFMEANRVDSTSFLFSDALRVFNLDVNPSAVEQQRSFAIDDVNGDGLVDLLTTSAASLFGGILLGDGNGGFHTVDTFVTGYEPTVASFGVAINGRRDVVSLNTRRGVVTVFRAGQHYLQLKTLSLGFVPDYIGHLVSPQDGLDYFMAAQSGNPQSLYRCNDDGTMESTGQVLPADPSAFFRKDFLSQNLVNIVQVYQVGSYVSVTLSDGRGQSFNVANMKVWPNVFLAVGDLSNRGTLDVAVAVLASSTPVK